MLNTKHFDPISGWKKVYADIFGRVRSTLFSAWKSVFMKVISTYIYLAKVELLKNIWYQMIRIIKELLKVTSELHKTLIRK